MPDPNGSKAKKSHKRVSLSNSWNTETGTLRIEWRDHQETVFNLGELPQSIVNDLCYHGLLARIQQAYVSAAGSPPAARDRAQKLWESLKAGDWGLSRGEKSISITAMALASLLSIPDLEAEARWSALSPEKKKEVQNRPDVLAQVAKMKAAKSEPQASLASILK